MTVSNSQKKIINKYVFALNYNPMSLINFFLDKL